MSLCGQLTVKQGVDVEESVARYNDGRVDFKSTVFRFQSTERGPRAEPPSWPTALKFDKQVQYVINN